MPGVRPAPPAPPKFEFADPRKAPASRPPKPKPGKDVFYFDLDGNYLTDYPANSNYIFLFNFEQNEFLDNENTPEPDAGGQRAKFFLRKFSKDPLASPQETLDHICSALQEMFIRQNILWLHIMQYWQQHLLSGKPGQDFFRTPPQLSYDLSLKYYLSQYKQNAEHLLAFLGSLGVTGAVWPLVDLQMDLAMDKKKLWGVQATYSFPYPLGSPTATHTGELRVIIDAAVHHLRRTSWGFVINFAVKLPDPLKNGTGGSSYISATSQRGYGMV